MNNRKPQVPQSLPEFERPVQTPQPLGDVPVAAESPAPGYDLIFSPEALGHFGKHAVATVRREDKDREAINQAFLGLYGPPPEARRAIAAGVQGRPRPQIAAAPAPRASAPRGTAPMPMPEQSVQVNKKSALERSSPRSNAIPGSKPENSTILNLKERFQKHRTWIIGSAVVALVVVGGSLSKKDAGGETTAAFSAQQAANELKNDSFAPGTSLAFASITTQGVEGRIPVQLKEAGHAAYLSIPIKPFSNNMAIRAKGVQDPKTKGSAVWANLNKDSNEYSINRAAFDLTVTPWAESFPLANIANALLPPINARPVTLYVDGKAADFTKYPVVNPPVIGLVDPKNPAAAPKAYDPNFIAAIADNLQLLTLKTLEDSNKCSQVLPALDQANAANLSSQNNLDKSVHVTINNGTNYGKASGEFASQKDVKAALGAYTLQIEGFMMSCPTKPVLPTVAKTPAATPKQSTAPAKK